ncbi:MAG: hypothetical protein HFG20_08010 [Anaerotruncus sp.]|nr:hypothetical protein [Anaerotruncus sp.]
MLLESGQVVRSTAGHDQGQLFVAVSVQGAFVWLVNGKTRPLEKPKRKSVKHIRKTNLVLEGSSIATNRKLRQALAAVEGGNQLV